MVRMTEEDLARFEANSGRTMAPEARAEIAKGLVIKRRPKYHNVPTIVGDWKFDSQLEAKRYKELCLLMQAGEILHFLWQVPYRLPGGATYRADFVVFHPVQTLQPEPDGAFPALVVIEDCKGYDTPTSVLKRKQVEELYGVQIKLIRRKKRK